MPAPMFPSPMNPISMPSTMPGISVGMKFSATMLQMGNNTGIGVPADVLACLGGGKRPAVVVNVNGYEYRSTVAPMGGKYLLPAIDVELTLYAAPRTVDVPDDLQSALDASTKAAAAWEKLSYAHRKEHVRSVLDAKKDETRARRIAAVTAKLGS